MARTVGSKNQKPAIVPHTVELSTEEKIEFLATLIVDRINEDLADGQKLLKRIEGHHATELRTTA
jgi:hypothetical protein